MVGGGSNNKFILVDGTGSAGKSTICKYFSKKNFLCFQIDNYFNDKRINFDNLFKKLKINMVKLIKFMIMNLLNI
jgi:uridine kinase